MPLTAEWWVMHGDGARGGCTTTRERRLVSCFKTNVLSCRLSQVGEKQNFLTFEVCCNDLDGEEVEVPSVRLRVK